MKTETKVIALSIFIGLIVWIIDSVLDYFIFYEGTFLDLLLFDVPNHEIYIRLVVLIIFAIFGIIISKIIIKRKQVEEALRLERDNFINILDTMEDGVCIIDQQYNMQYVNPTLVKIFGLPERHKCYEYFQDRKEVCPWCRNLEVFAGKSVHWEWYYFKNNMIFDIIDTPLKNVDGSISKLEILHNITKRKQAEETLRLHSEMLENMGEGVYLVRTSDGIIVYANPRFEEMFGYESGEIIGQHVSIVNAPTDVSPEEKVDVIMEKLMQDGVWHGEVQNIKKDGTTFWCHANVSVFDHSEYGEVLVSVHGDITKRKEAEEKLKQYAEDLKRSNEFKDIFTDILRHDLLNPAGIIKGYTELLLEMEGNGIKINSLHKIESSNEKLIDIIEAAAKFAKFESVEELEFEVKDIAVIIKDVADNFRPQIENKQMEFEFKAKGAYPANVNPVIEEVFANLLSNAIKYSSQKSKIIVDILDVGENWKVTVTDFGEGVSDEYKPLLFERFKRVNKSCIKGTGLGLAIVKRIIELHGGDVGIEDNPAGEGSVFWVTVGKA